MNDVTRILSHVTQGEEFATDQLLPLVYDELRCLAAQKLAHEQPGQTLQATALVHEAYLRLVDPNHAPAWENRAHFFTAAAEAMRRILVDRARNKHRLKRGGIAQREFLDLDKLAKPAGNIDFLALDEALTELERVEPTAAALVKLRFFAGLGQVQAAEALNLPRRSADRLWAFARAWLYQRMEPAE